MKKIVLCMLLLMGLVACSQEDEPLTGTLVVESYIFDVISDLSVRTESGNVIYTKPGGVFSLELNPGNYSVQPQLKSSGYAAEAFFQIRAGRTTRVVYSSAIAVVEYE